MGKQIPDSYEYNYLRFYNGEREVELLKKAYKIDPKRADALYELVMYYESIGDSEKLEKFCKDLYQSGDISPGLLDYNYNVLVSTEKNGILFTNGDNDTYPAWVLQHALGIRKDVAVLNLHMTFTIREYLKGKLDSKGINLDVDSFSKESMNIFSKELTEQISAKYPKIPVHVALTVYKGSIREIEENLYLVGLNFKYNRKRFDNIQSIKDNIYNKLRLDYLDYDWYSNQYLVTSLLDNLHVNYVVVFLKLAENLHESGKSAEAIKWKDKALKLATKANNEQFLRHINELDW
jgi:tetratricopeptide (TPR) repeat protein